MKKALLPFIAFLALGSTSVLAQCGPNEVEVAVQILTDNWGYETHWTLTDPAGDTLAMGGQGGVYANNSWHGDTVCVPDGICLRLSMNDTYGDGLGEYSVLMDGTLVGSGVGNIGYGQFHDFNCPPGTTCSSALVVSEGTHTSPAANTWYSFTPAQNGNYEISTCGNNCDTKVWIYDYCTNLVWGNTNEGTQYYDDNQGGCGEQAVVGAALLEGGVEYWIRIGDDGGDCSGAIDFSITYNGPIAGCMDPNNCHYNPLATISIPCEPCTDGPDLVVRQDVFQSSMYLASMNVSEGDCFIEELCMNGYGQRDILRFTTHILNIGTLDYYIGSPGANPDQFDFDNCHGHTHYAGYAAYRLFDTEANEIPIGFKNGFCVMDLECSGGGSAQYGCGTMGITAGCGDIYSSGLSCQWIDITDVDTGLYTFVITTNWDQDPDALGHHELDYSNNWAQACIYIGRDGNGDLFVDQVQDCSPYVDCNGQIYGPSQPDCNGDCGGVALRGDLNSDTAQTLYDGGMYVDAILDASLTPAACNDLNDDGAIDVFDAALLTDCALYNEGQNTGAIYNHCEFPYGLNNIFDTVQFSIGNVSFANDYFDVYVTNPDNPLVAYQLTFGGIEISNVENLITVNDYPVTPDFNVGGDMMLSISFEDSLIKRYNTPTPLCRVHYSNVTGNEICIAEVVSSVNEYYEETESRIVDGCVAYNVGIDEVDNGGVTMELFPNPMETTATLKVNNKFNTEISVALMDPAGRLVRDYGQLTSETLTINRNELSSGIYFIQITDDSRILNRERFIVQ